MQVYKGWLISFDAGTKGCEQGCHSFVEITPVVLLHISCIHLEMKPSLIVDDKQGF